MSVERDIGEIFARIDALEGTIAKTERRLDGVADDIRAIRSTLDRARGGWRAVIVVGGAIAAMSSAATGLVVKWLGGAG